MTKLTASELPFLKTFHPWLKANKRGWNIYLRYRKEPDEFNNPFEGEDLRIAQEIYVWMLKGSNEAKFRAWWDDVQKEEEEEEEEEEGQGVEQEKGPNEQQNEQQLQENEEHGPPNGEHSSPLAQQPEEGDKGTKRPHETDDGNTAKKRKEMSPVEGDEQNLQHKQSEMRNDDFPPQATESATVAPTTTVVEESLAYHLTTDAVDTNDDAVEHPNITTAGAELGVETITSRIRQIEEDNDLRKQHKWKVMPFKRGRFRELIEEQRAAYEAEEETKKLATKKKEKQKKGGSGMFGGKHKSKKKAETGGNSTGVQKDVFQQDVQKEV